MVEAAFGDEVGYGIFHVGSSLTRADWRDVDVRTMLQDEEFDRLFGGNRLRLKFLNVTISEWLTARTGLPVDFQFQRASDANAEFGGRPRNFVAPSLASI